MKTITYTQMRSDLSATLELLRSGEDVTVTQRGKPDLLLKAEVVNTTIVEGEILPAGISERIELANKAAKASLSETLLASMTPQMKEGMMNAAKQLDNLLASDEARKMMLKLANSAIALQGVSESFVKALQHTQIKHADIIKKLEDK